MQSPQPYRSRWKRPLLWISALIVLLIAAVSGYYLLLQRNTPSSTGIPTSIDYVQAISFSPDGRLLAAAADNFDDGGNFTNSSMIVWNVASGQKLHVLPTQQYFTAVAFSPDGHLVAAGSEDENILLWNVASGKAIASHFADSNAVYSVTFSPDGQLLATGDDDGTVKLWNVSNGHLLKTFPAAAPVGGSAKVAFSPDGQLLAIGSTTITLWNVATGTQLSPFPDANKIITVSSLAFSPDGNVLAFSSEATASGNTETVTLWDVTGKAKTRTLVGQDGLIYSISFSPDGRMLAAALDPGIIERWDVASGKKLPDIQGTNEIFVAFDPVGHILASGGGDYSSNPKQDTPPAQQAYVELWDASTGRQLRILK